MNSENDVQTEEGLCHPSSGRNEGFSAKAALAVVAVALMMSAGVLVLFAPAEIEAATDAELIIGNYKYNVNDDGTLTAVGFNPDYLKKIVAAGGDASGIDIPGYVYGDDGTRYHVTTVGADWAENLGNMFVTNVYIGEGVEIIVDSAFKGIRVDVSSHSEIYIPPTVTYIGNNAFYVAEGFWGFSKIVLDNVWVTDEPRVKFVSVFFAGYDTGVEIAELEPNIIPDSPSTGEQPCYLDELNGKRYDLFLGASREYYFFDFSKDTIFDCGDFKYKATSAGAELIGFADGFTPASEYEIVIPNTVKDSDDKEYLVSSVSARLGKFIERDYKGVVVTGITIGDNVGEIASGAFEGIAVKEKIDLKLSSVKLGTNSFMITIDESADAATSGIGSLTLSGMGIINRSVPSDVFGFEFCDKSGEEITSFDSIDGKYVFENGTFHPSASGGGDSGSTGIIVGAVICVILLVFAAAVAIVISAKR